MSVRCFFFVLTTITLLAGASSATAGPGGFWDPGLTDGGWRTDYASPQIGTAAHPLTYDSPCLFPHTPFAICPDNFVPIPGSGGPQPATSFSRSNWVSAPNGPTDRFWVATANVEPALDSNCNSGPPDQSEAILKPFEGVFGIGIEPADDIHRPWQNEAVLAVDLSHRSRQLEQRPNCRPGEFIPFLGFGIYRDRGAGGQPLAMLATGSHAPVLRFNYRLVDSNAAFFGTGESIPPRPRGQYSGLMVEAEWGGRKHDVWVDLLNLFGPPGPTVFAPWNWSVRESFYYPGAEIVFTSGPTLRAECGANGFDLPSIAPQTYADRQPIPMRLDLRRLYECVGHLFSSPFPRGQNVPLTGMQFWVEVGIREHDGLPGLSLDDYDSRLGIAVSDIDIVPASGSPTSSDAALTTQLGNDLLGRAWSTAERTHWLERFTAVGRSAAIAEMLHTHEVRRTLTTAAVLNLIGIGRTPDRGVFNATLASLRDGHALPAVVNELTASTAFSNINTGLDDAAFVRRMYRNALGGDLDQQADRQQIGDSFGSVNYWVSRLQNGSAGRDQVLLSVTRLALARNLLGKQVDIMALYRTFFGVLPDGGGIGGWSGAPDMPMRLAEILYYNSLYRDRFVD